MHPKAVAKAKVQILWSFALFFVPTTTIKTKPMSILRQLLNYLFCNCGFISFRITLTANQIKTGNTIPIEIPELTAPGAGYAWSIVMAELKYTFGTAPFT